MTLTDRATTRRAHQQRRLKRLPVRRVQIPWKYVRVAPPFSMATALTTGRYYVRVAAGVTA